MQNAHSLFYALVALRRPRTICDVGSLDGSAAFRFRKLRPGARIIAFEANPRHYTAICADPRSSGIQIRREAVSDEDGDVTFHVLDAPPSNQWAAGLSSLNRRTAEMQLGFVEREVRVPACRLDSALRDVPAPIALWVDVEGAAGRVVDGFEGIADRVSFMCIELETRPMWEGQLDASEVLNKLAAFGFSEVVRSEEWPEGDLGQVNVVLTRNVGRGALRSAKALAAAAQGASEVLSVARRARETA